MSASIIASVVTGGSNSHQTVAEELNNVATDFVSQGVVGAFTSGSPNTGAFAVTQDASPDMGVTILTGRAYVSGTPTGQDSQVLSARMTSNYTGYTINANASGSTKYDWIYLALSATNANTPSSAADNVITLVTSRSTSNATDNGSPPTYGLLLAVVTVANGASSITNGNITDKRVQSQLSVQSAATTGWQTLGFPLTYGANNGNKEFTVTTPNNLTGVLSPGMKLNITRSVTPPTQCMAFSSASSQYATKASPSGITFTSAFTCEAWVYLLSNTGTQQAIITRTDSSTGGFSFIINASGQVRIFYGSSSSFTDFISYQSIPLNRWVHVAAAVTSTSSKTANIFINGVLVPSASSLTAATTLSQVGSLQVGAQAGGTFFNGYISEARIWGVAQTQASIQSNMAVNCVGNETNLVGLWQGSGNFNDSTSNANNLTATNGASATQATNPYNPTEYAIITKLSYSNPTTTIILSTGDMCTIPNQTLNSPQYSVAQQPLGLPNDLSATVGRRLIWIPLLASQSTTSTTQTAFGGSNSAWTCTIPANVTTVKVRGFGTSLATSGIIGLAIYNGSISSSNLVAQANSTSSNGFINIDTPVPVIPGSTFTLNAGWNVTTGTGTWGSTGSGAPQMQGLWLETA